MKVADQVRNLLKFSEKARSDDKELHILYLQRAGLDLSENQIKLLKELPSFETIRRVRQKIQESGELLPNKKVQQARQEKAQIIRQNISDSSPEYVEQILSDGSTHRLPHGYKILEEE